METSLGVYVHVPFCRSRCRYCDFYSTLEEARIRDYVEALEREITFSPCRGASLDTVYFGGGTPSLLAPEDVGRILHTLDQHYGLEKDAEITLEANPGTVNRESLKALRSLGVNRLSLGVQSLDDRNLIFLGRGHTVEEALRAWEGGRAAGFTNMGLDLIYGLPGQDRKSWGKDLERAFHLAPEHLSLYMLSIEEGTPMGRDLASGHMEAPDDGGVADLLRFTFAFTEKAGYPWYEVSNFAKHPDFQSRHNRRYWEGRPWLGLGPGAHGYLPPLRYANTRDLDTYIRSMGNACPAREMEEVIDLEAARTEALYLGFRTRRGVDVAAFDHQTGGDFVKTCENLLSRYVHQGFLCLEGGYCRLTEEGMVFLDAITADFVALF